MPIKIIADSACGLSQEVIEEKDVDIIPYMISFGEERYYKDFFELDAKGFYTELTKREYRPRTSTPTFDAFLSSFEKYASLGYDVIYINMTSAFTSGYSVAVSAANQVMEAHENVEIIVVDSCIASEMEGFLVLEAVRLKEEGWGVREIADEINSLKENVGAVFSLETLSYALRGGRLGKMGAMIGDFLKIKPVIVLKDGGLSLYSKARTQTKVMEQTITAVIELTKGFIKEKVTYVMFHAEAYEEVLELGRRFTEKTGYQFKSLPSYICATIGAHSGPGLIGIGFYVSR